jgi:hypothetical protein
MSSYWVPVPASARHRTPFRPRRLREPGKVFDAVTDLEGVPAGYRDMDQRKSLKVLVRP